MSSMQVGRVCLGHVFNVVVCASFLLAVVLFTTSIYYHLRVPISWAPDRWVDIFGGSVMYTWESTAVMDGRVLQMYIERNPFRHVYWMPQYSNMGAGSGTVLLPVWPLVILVTVVLVWRMRSARGAPTHNHCLGCGYNLTGNLSGVCPECGRPIKSVRNAP